MISVANSNVVFLTFISLKNFECLSNSLICHFNYFIAEHKIKKTWLKRIMYTSMLNESVYSQVWLEVELNGFLRLFTLAILKQGLCAIFYARLPFQAG